MDEQEEVYKPLGSKTLVMFLLQKIGILFFFGVAIIIFFMLSQAVPSEYIVLFHTIAALISVVGVIVFALLFLVASITYARYGITLTADDVKVTRGFINEEELGIPYRRVTDARIERNVAGQLLGTSDILINIAGANEGGPQGATSLIVLPAIDKDLAAHIQGEIIKRAEIEEVRVK